MKLRNTTLLLLVLIPSAFSCRYAEAWTPCTADDPRPQPQSECYPANPAPPQGPQGPSAAPDPGTPSPAPVAVPSAPLEMPRLTFASKGICEETATDIYQTLVQFQVTLVRTQRELAAAKKKNRRK